MSKVFIYSIPRETATGISSWRSNVSGKSLKKSKFGDSTDTLVALYSPKHGCLKSGMYHSWLENGEVKKDSKGNVLTLQDKYEQQFSLEKGALHSRLAPQTCLEDDLSLIQRAKLVLRDGCTVLDTSKLEDLIKYHIALESKYVANSEKEWREHKAPHALYYIALENEGEEIKYAKNEIKSKGFAALHAETMNDLNKRKLVVILDLANSRTDLSGATLHNLLFEYVDRAVGTKGFDQINKFINLVNMLNQVDTKIRLENMYLLKQCLDYKVLYEKQGGYSWIRQSGTIEIGQTYDEALDFLANPKKSALVEELNSELKARKI